MLAPVRAVVRFMETRDRPLLRGAFAARDVAIVENFAPFVFRGAGAVRRWALAFCAHARSLSALRASWERAQDFSVDGERAYFTLPTTWTGLDGGRSFVEIGAWVFVIQRSRGTWRILSYAWGVTSFDGALLRDGSATRVRTRRKAGKPRKVERG
jgi:hypothetical protein